MLDDVTYFGLREYEEMRAALGTADPKSRAAHFELARRYRELIVAIEAEEERLGCGPTTGSTKLTHDQ